MVFNKYQHPIIARRAGRNTRYNSGAYHDGYGLNQAQPAINDLVDMHQDGWVSASQWLSEETQ